MVVARPVRRRARHVGVACTNTDTGAAPLRASMAGRDAGAWATGITPPPISRTRDIGPLLVEAMRSGEYRPVAAAIRENRIAIGNNAQEMWARLTLLAECVRAAYDGDPHDLPMLLREMEDVWETLIVAAQSDAEADGDRPPPIIDALNRATGIVPFVTTGYEPGQTICTQEDRDPILYCVRSGHVRLTEPLPDGRMVTLSILRAGGIFGTMDAQMQPGISADAMTHSDITLFMRASYRHWYASRLGRYMRS